MDRRAKLDGGPVSQEVVACIGTTGDHSIPLPKGLTLLQEERASFSISPGYKVSIPPCAQIMGVGGIEQQRTGKHMCSKSKDGNQRRLSVWSGKGIGLNKGHRILEDVGNGSVRGWGQH